MDNPPFEDVFPIQDGDFEASYVCLPEGRGPTKIWFLWGADFFASRERSLT